MMKTVTNSKCGFVTILLKKPLYKPHKTIYNADINKKKPHKFRIKQTQTHKTTKTDRRDKNENS